MTACSVDRTALAACSYGEHAIWWVVEAPDEQQALALLPFFVAQRSTVTPRGRSRPPLTDLIARSSPCHPRPIRGAGKRSASSR